MMRRQIAELAGQQSSDVATIFLRYSGTRCSLQCLLRGFRASPLMLVAVRWKKRTLSPSTQAYSTRHLGEIQGYHRRLNGMIKRLGETLRMSPRTIAQTNPHRSQIQRLRWWRWTGKTQKTMMVCWSSQESELDLIITTRAVARSAEDGAYRRLYARRGMGFR